MFDIEKFPNTWFFTQVIQDGLGISFETFEKPIDFIHKEVLGAWACMDADRRARYGRAVSSFC